MNKAFLRTVVANCLLSNKAMSFPVNAIEIKLTSKVVKIIAYCDSAEMLKLSGLAQYAQDKKGFIFHKEDYLYYLFYDETMACTEKDFVFAHEFGHINLGHSVAGLHLGKAVTPSQDDEQEFEADYFGMYYKAHPAVLYKANVKSARQISMITGLSLERAKIISAEISKLTDELLSADEIRLCEQFVAFINEYRAINKVKPKNKLKLASVIPLVLIVSITAFFLRQKAIPEISAPVNSTSSYNEQARSVSEQIVYVTRTGEKFHKIDCHYAKEKAFDLELYEAISSGYSSCKICKPLGE